MFSWHDNLKRYTYVRGLVNSSRQWRLLLQVKNGCFVRRTRWQEGIVNLTRETCDGWILQSTFKPRDTTSRELPANLHFCVKIVL